jgi:predicted phage-related endonuclease
MNDIERESWEITSTAEWLEWRRRDITASRVGALFDCHPYLSRDQLAALMRGSSDAGTSSVPDNAAMRRGRILEPAVAAAIAEERPEWTLTKATTYHRLPELRLGCTPDYWATSTDPREQHGDGLIQIKTVNPAQWDRWQARPPLVYVLQTLTEMIVTGRAWGWLAIMVCSPSYPVHYCAVPRHPEAEARLLRAVAQWWAEFDSGALAPAAEAAGLAEALDDGSSIDLSGDSALPGILDEREMLRQSLTMEEGRLKELDYQIKNRIGRAKTGWLPGWVISYATSHRKETVIAARDIRTLRIRRLAEQDAVE